MTETTGDPSATAAPAATAPPGAAPVGTIGIPLERLNLLYVAIIGVAIGIVAIATGFAWPLAILLGMMVGRAGVQQARGVKAPAAWLLLQALGLVLGFFAMVFLGALVGGIIALAIVAMAAFFERVVANTSSTDQGIGRILLFIVATLTWGVLFFVLQLKININVGG